MVYIYLYLHLYILGKTSLCWAFAISSMLRQSLISFVKSLDSSTYNTESALRILKGKEFHRRLRSELIMVPIPKPISSKAKSPNDIESIYKSQSHNVEFAIDRVSLFFYNLKFLVLLKGPP